MAITQQTVTVTAPARSSTGTATATFPAGAKLISAVPLIPDPAAGRTAVEVRAAIAAGGVATVQVTPALIPVDVLVSADV